MKTGMRKVEPNKKKGTNHKINDEEEPTETDV
jgi:hypothetical protein